MSNLRDGFLEAVLTLLAIIVLPALIVPISDDWANDTRPEELEAWRLEDKEEERF